MIKKKVKKDIRIGLVVTPEEKNALAKISLDKDVSMATIVRVAVKEYIEREGK